MDDTTFFFIFEETEKWFLKMFFKHTTKNGIFNSMSMLCLYQNPLKLSYHNDSHR